MLKRIRNTLRLFFANLLIKVDIRWIDITPLIFNLLILLLDMFEHLPGGIACDGQIEMENEEPEYGYADDSSYYRGNDDDCDLADGAC